ncbi:IQ-domain 11 [Hirschfeldia incana]|nr:IQ-domain 11 [Hirschfeldia incana]KAJ0260882.1 IQ-domain 11 [Hirschfeldia incana]
MTNNKKGLFTLLKRVFISEANSEKKEKRRRWTFWKLKVRKRVPSITAPPPENGTRNESHEEHKEESVSEIGEVSQVSSSSQKLDSSIEKLETGSTSPETAHLVAQYQLFLNREKEVLAATRIQTAFRGHLARKALRALKGIVKLQAYIRGRAVRRQAMTTLKCLQSVVNIQSQVYGKRTHIPRAPHRDYEESNTFHMLNENTLKVDTNGQKRWDDSLLTKEEARAVVMSKREAALRRERIKEYAVTHRKSAESYQKRSNTKWKYWLDEWVDTQRTKSKELEDLDLSSRTKPKEETMNKTPRNSSPRRLGTNNHRRQASISEEEPQNPVAPVTVTTPTYMVATESAKAKSRSLSSPRIRPRSFDTQSESYSPYKNKLCLTSSVMSEAPSKVRVGNSNGNNSRASAYQQRSPGLRGFSIGPLKSCNNGTLLNDLSINSERSLPSWSKQSSLR